MTKAEQFYMAQERVAEYDRQSNQLVLDSLKFDYTYDNQHTLQTIVYQLRNSFKEVETHLEVLGPQHFRPNAEFSSGFCFISSYLIYSMTGGDAVWEIHAALPMHWWLVHRETNTIFDITYSQFKPEMLRNMYQNGKKIELNPDTIHLLQERAHKLAKRAGLE